jgi:hypothetical protein
MPAVCSLFLYCISLDGERQEVVGYKHLIQVLDMTLLILILR